MDNVSNASDVWAWVYHIGTRPTPPTFTKINRRDPPQDRKPWRVTEQFRPLCGAVTAQRKDAAGLAKLVVYNIHDL
ncbi:hypothetical protein MRX96_021803 [Rhipicephalus microplus]